MQAYGSGFARIYNTKWIAYATQIAPLIQRFFESTAARTDDKTLLDLCCGTGQLALHFLEQGYEVVGIDLSEEMLNHARENATSYVDSGQASFVNADAADFTLAGRFSLVVSTFDSLNHLPDAQALKDCFACAYAVCRDCFIFDLNTRKGLANWNCSRVDDSDENVLLIRRGSFDERSDKAWMQITGFVRQPNGLFERFDEEVYNTVFALADVRAMLLECGWREAYFARMNELQKSLAEPEEEGRVFVVARI